MLSTPRRRPGVDAPFAAPYCAALPTQNGRAHAHVRSGFLLSPELLDAARVSPAWPFEEAKKLVKRIEASGQKSVLFETPYGPSGLPHIGTFGEVARTSMVRRALKC